MIKDVLAGQVNRTFKKPKKKTWSWKSLSWFNSQPT